MRKKIEAHVTRMKLIPNINQFHKDFLNIPEAHRCLGLIACDVENIMYLALDDATKKADILVQHASATYAGMKGGWSRYGGCVYVLMSGPRIEDVRTGLRYVNDFIDNQSALANFDGIPAFGFYAQCIPRVGSYYGNMLGIPSDSAYAYLLGPPIEANYALDKALKSGDVILARYWYPPAKVNSSGGIIYGTESACKAATQAFIEGLHYAFEHPLDI